MLPREEQHGECPLWRGPEFDETGSPMPGALELRVLEIAAVLKVLTVLSFSDLITTRNRQDSPFVTSSPSFHEVFLVFPISRVRRHAPVSHRRS